MLTTHWNEASRALPVSTLKPNYLDRWPNGCNDQVDVIGMEDERKIIKYLELSMPYLLNTHTSSFPDVWFSLTNTTYQNNSLVTLEDIGEDAALLCKTNQMACCRPSDTVLGNWFFPNGTRVPSQGYQWDFYRDRGQMVVQLHRRRGGENGIYNCEISDSMNVIRTIYIGVYTTNTSTGK